MVYKLNLEKFSGPIEKLLELIEEKKLEITELNLAEVTADFLEYFKEIKTISERAKPRLLADFIVVASRLLLIKSKALLPNLKLTEEEEKDIKDLENRLVFYRNFKPAIGYVKKTTERKTFSFSRPLFFGRPPVFYPPPNLNAENLKLALISALESFKTSSVYETEIIEASIVSLEEKIKEVIKTLEEGVQHFGKLTREKSKVEVIVLFLAILHLLREQLIKVEQNSGFSDIMIKKI